MTKCYSTQLYKHHHKSKSTASILYDVSVFFQQNMIAFNLETRKLDIVFNNATKNQVFRKLILTENYLPFKTNSFQAYFERSKKLAPLIRKAKRIQSLLDSNSYGQFSASYKDVEVYLILEKVLKSMTFPCLLSNKIKGNLTLHLKQSNPFEVLAYIMDGYDLVFLQLDKSCLIKPRNE